MTLGHGFRAAVLGLGCLALLAGCSKGGDGLISRSLPLLEAEIFGPPERPPPKPVRRETLNKIPFATISVASKATADRKSFIVAVADSNGRVTYQEPSGRSVVLAGSLLSSTNGLGLDLAAVKHQLDDPIAVLTPIQDWPQVIRRNYQFSRAKRPNWEITVVCTLQRVARERITVVELGFDVTRVQETCRSSRRVFTNLYWVGDNGIVWRSEQWAGPELDKLIIETIRPYAT